MVRMSARNFVKIYGILLFINIVYISFPNLLVYIDSEQGNIIIFLVVRAITFIFILPFILVLLVKLQDIIGKLIVCATFLQLYLLGTLLFFIGFVVTLFFGLLNSNLFLIDSSYYWISASAACLFANVWYLGNRSINFIPPKKIKPVISEYKITNIEFLNFKFILKKPLKWTGNLSINNAEPDNVLIYDLNDNYITSFHDIIVKYFSKKDIKPIVFSILYINMTDDGLIRFHGWIYIWDVSPVNWEVKSVEMTK